MMCKAKIYCINSSKGGIGKSTSVQTIGVLLHQMGYKVLCIDTDNQSHLSISFLKDIIPESLPLTLTNLIESFINQELITFEMVNNAIIKTNTVDLLPSTFLLDKLETVLNSMNDKAYALTEIIEPIRELYDYILIDCGSSRNIFTINALTISDFLIIPCQCQFLSGGAIELIMSTVKSLKRRINPNLQIKGILMTMYHGNTNQSKATVASVKHEYGKLVFDTIIPSSTKVPDAQRLGLSVIEYDKNNPVSVAYTNFVTKELIDNE